MLDNASPEHEADVIEQKWPNVRLIRSERNLGFGGGHNEIIRQSDSEYYFCANIDMVFSSTFVEELVLCMEKHPKAASVTGKLLKWQDCPIPPRHFSEKRGVIDTTGLFLHRSQHAEEIGAGKIDFGQYDKETEIFGASGAAVLFRRESLEDVAFVNREEEKEYFDELFFLYKEDIDLMYRLRWAGWESWYTPKAIAWHDRTTAVSSLRDRRNRSLLVREQSFLNHEILLAKNWSDSFSFRTKLSRWWYELRKSWYLRLFERDVWIAKERLSLLVDLIAIRRKAIKKRVHAKEIERWFQKDL